MDKQTRGGLPGPAQKHSQTKPMKIFKVCQNATIVLLIAVVPALLVHLSNFHCDSGTATVKKCLDILNKIADDPEAEAFLEPVDFVGLEIPSYPIAVPAPMDLGTMQKRLRTGFYGEDAAEVLSSVESHGMLIFRNCMSFNEVKSPLWVAAKRFSNIFAKACTDARKDLKIFGKAVDNARRTSKKLAEVCENKILKDLEKTWHDFRGKILAPPPISISEHYCNVTSFNVVSSRLKAGFYGGPNTCLPNFANDVITLCCQFQQQKISDPHQSSITKLLKSFAKAVHNAAKESELATMAARLRISEVIPEQFESLNMEMAFKMCVALCNTLKKKSAFDVFINPVPREYVDYHQQIKKPMCISQVLRNLRMRHQSFASSNGNSDTNKKSVILFVQQFVEDMRLIWLNCTAYNAAGSTIYRSAVRMRDLFEYNFSAAATKNCEIRHHVYKQDRQPAVEPKLNIKSKNMRRHLSSTLDKILLRLNADHLCSPHLSQAFLQAVDNPLDFRTMQHRLEWCVYINNCN